VLSLAAAAQKASEWNGKSVTTESLTIVDGDGEPRISMTVTKEDGAVFVIMGGTTESNVKTGIKLRVKESVPAGVFVGKKGKASLGANEGNNRPFFDLVDEKKKLIWGVGGNAIKD
jgi:ethanolamine utilization microcompartment shell protein EutL